MLVYWRVDRIWKCQKISPRIGMVLKSPCSINYCTWWLYHTIQMDSDMGICIKIYRDRNGQKKHPSLQMENQPFVDHVPSEKTHGFSTSVRMFSLGYPAERSDWSTVHLFSYWFQLKVGNGAMIQSTTIVTCFSPPGAESEVRRCPG